MKKLLFFIFFVLLFSCNKKKRISFADNAYDNGTEFYYKKNYDSAFVNFYKASQAFTKSRENKGIINSFIYLSIIQTEKGDFLGSNESLRKATKFVENNDNESFISIYNQFAINHNDLKNYNQAIYCYNKARSFSKNTYSNLIIENNIGVTNLKIKNYSKALNIFKSISENPRIKDSVDFKNRVLDNLAYTKSLIHENHNAEKELISILKNRIKRNDLSGANASLSHLADYFNNKDHSKSLFYAKAMYNNSKITGSTEDQLDALKKIIKFEDSKNVKLLFEEYQTLTDSIQNINNNSKGLFTSIIYEAEKNKRENEEKENKLLKQYILAIILVILIITIVIWYRKRQKQLKQEKELEVKNTQLKMSKKVHDVVANGIYQVMTKIENQEDFDKDKALDELEFVYEKSRDISYEKIDTIHEEKDFDEKISELIGSFNNENVKTYLAVNEKDIWKNVNNTTQDEVYQIIRELLVNMKKHSQANRVAFRFERENNLINIFYTDNGIGISGDLIYKNGLSSTVSRIETIRGEIIFDTKTEKGLKINISFPVS